jgi:hypothetical protein
LRAWRKSERIGSKPLFRENRHSVMSRVGPIIGLAALGKLRCSASDSRPDTKQLGGWRDDPHLQTRILLKLLFTLRAFDFLLILS